MRTTSILFCDFLFLLLLSKIYHFNYCYNGFSSFRRIDAILTFFYFLKSWSFFCVYWVFLIYYVYCLFSQNSFIPICSNQGPNTKMLDHGITYFQIIFLDILSFGILLSHFFSPITMPPSNPNLQITSSRRSSLNINPEAFKHCWGITISLSNWQITMSIYFLLMNLGVDRSKLGLEWWLCFKFQICGSVSAPCVYTSLWFWSSFRNNQVSICSSHGLVEVQEPHAQVHMHNASLCLPHLLTSVGQGK